VDSHTNKCKIDLEQDSDDHQSIGDKTNDNDGDLVCKYCSKEFSRIDSLNRHLKSSCKVKITTERENHQKQQDQRLQEVLDRLTMIETRCKSDNVLSNQPNPNAINVNTNSNNNNTINSNNNNSTVNIQLVAFGKEDKSKLTNKEILKLLNHGYHSVPALLKAIHFDKNRPENHNIYISNDRASVVQVFDGERWNAVDRTETIQNLFNDGRDFLLTKAEEFNEREKPLTDRAKKMVLKFERFDNDVDEYPVKKKEIFTMIRNMLYNERNMVENTKKTIELHNINLVTR
jgi:hypothetical protein